MLRSASVSSAATLQRGFKVAVIGAYGGIGQPLALLCKLDQNITKVSVFDLNPATPGQAADLSHINTPATVEGFTGDQLGAAVKGADIVIIPAGVPRKPGMTRDDLFNTNASIVANIAKAVAENAPQAHSLIISNPVNSTVPIYAEILKKYGKYDPRKLFGVTTLDVVRANTFLADNLKRDVNSMNVPVIGGHAGITIVPLLSATGGKFSDEDRDRLTNRIMFGGDEVVKAKAGAGSATLSMAYAGHAFARSLMRALKGEQNVVECTYVDTDAIFGAKSAPTSYFSYPVLLGKNGAEALRKPQLNEYEQGLVAKAVPELEQAITKGKEFAAAWVPK